MTRLHFVFQPISQSGPSGRWITVSVYTLDYFGDICYRSYMGGRIEFMDRWREEWYG